MNRIAILLLCVTCFWTAVWAQEILPIEDVPIYATPEQADSAPAPTMSRKEEFKQSLTTIEIRRDLPVWKRFYNHAGKNYLSFVSAGYSTFFLMPRNPGNYPVAEYFGKRHIINFEVLEIRSRIFGVQWLNFEFGVNNTCTTSNGVQLTRYMRGGNDEYANHHSGVIEATGREMWFAYKPGLKVYIPINEFCAALVYGGLSVDITRMWSSFFKHYYPNTDIPANNYFMGSYVGAGFVFMGTIYMPVEIKCEYRHPHTGNKGIVPQGFYLSAQVHLGKPYKRHNY